MRLFDSHCHVDERQFDADRAEVHRRMAERGVARFAVLGSDLETSRHAIDYAAAHPGAVAAIGFHPEYADRCDEASLATLAAWAGEAPVRAIGEIGLDYYWPDNPDREVQKRACVAQLALAKSLNLPVAFHVRDAHADMEALLKANRSLLTGGIMHCFSGSWETAKECLDMGFYLGFGGALTFKNAKKNVEVAAKAPLDRLVVETDCPYMAPVPFRGKRNDPTKTLYVVQKLAELRAMAPEDLAPILFENGQRLFSIQ